MKMHFFFLVLLLLAYSFIPARFSSQKILNEPYFILHISHYFDAFFSAVFTAENLYLLTRGVLW